MIYKNGNEYNNNILKPPSPDDCDLYAEYQEHKRKYKIALIILSVIAIIAFRTI